MYKDHLWAAILAGGGGTRLWPLSRERNPKQFIKLFGKKTLLQVTAERLSEIVSWSRMFVVTTNKIYAREIRKELRRLPEENILVEPARRGTAIAHGLAAVYILSHNPQAIILNAYADSMVDSIPKYLGTLKVAAQAAFSSHKLVAVGFKPTFPHTGLGHIKFSKIETKVNGRPVFRVDKFVEKPLFNLAKKYFESGDYLWNAGMYVWRADSILDAIKRHAPKISQALQKIQSVLGSKNEEEVVTSVYKDAPNISIDYAVSEKEKDFLVVKADFDWIDVGDWNVVWDLTQKDKNGNAAIHLNGRGEWMSIDTENTLVQTDKLLIATIGIKDLVIIETKDAVLIANKSEAERVKEMVNLLKEENKEEFL